MKVGKLTDDDVWDLLGMRVVKGEGDEVGGKLVEMGIERDVY